jgi:uncharacterized repeat protein (TIGR03806 family)
MYVKIAVLSGAIFLALVTTKQTVASETTCRIAGTPNVASITLKKVATGFERPVAAIFNPLDKTEYFVVEQSGLIRKVKNGTVQPTPILDLKSVVNSSDNETGLLGLALHPNFKTNKRVFVNYTTETRPRTVVSEFKMNAAGTIDRSSEKVILEIPQPYSNHNGGDIKFGKDGYLYIGTGDGGSANDPHGNGQNLSALLGKMLRIDIDGGSPYSIPADNPTFRTAGARREIYAYGLRNPWRYSFDRVTGKLWAADVGQNALEEINVIEKGGNYGWKIMEGTQCFRSTTGNRDGLKLPVHEYPRSEGVSVTGGYVYRGSAIPSLVGRYVFADYATGKVWGFVADSANLDNKLLVESNFNVSSFAEDIDGELYALDHRGGSIFRIEKGTQSAGNFPTKLSETGCFASLSPLTPASGVVGYEVESELWSDGAEKTRFVTVPDGEKIGLGGSGFFSFPEGSMLIKNFYIPVRSGGQIRNDIIETRFLVKLTNGFAGYTYLWNEARTDAEYIAGSQHIPVTMATGQTDTPFDYYIPSGGDCNRCHPAAGGGSAGFTPQHLNIFVNSTSGQENQLMLLSRLGVLDSTSLPGDLSSLGSLVDPHDTTIAIEERARSWMHTNCASCHHPVSGTATGSMDFRATVSLPQMKICGVAPQHGDLGVQQAKLLVPGDADKSLLWLRVHSQDKVSRMPPVATSRRDEQASELLKTWINDLTDCE